MEAGSPGTPAVCRGAAHWPRSWGTPGQGVMPLETYTTSVDLHDILNLQIIFITDLITSTIDIAGAHSKTVAGTKTKDPEDR